MKQGKITIYADAAHSPVHEMDDLMDTLRHLYFGNVDMEFVRAQYIAADAVLNAFMRTKIFDDDTAWKYRNRLNAVRNELKERMKN